MIKELQETDRLLVKILREGAEGAVCDFYKRNKGYFEPFEPERAPGFYTEEFHRRGLAAEYHQYQQGRYLRLYLYEKSQPELIIGSICFDNIRMGSFQSCSVGYKLDGEYQNQGYMLEALTYSLNQIILRDYVLHRIEAMVVAENTPSIHLLERLGFEQEGVCRDFAKLNGVWRDHIRYALIFKR
jgi:ribosomal-protein-alanine N-acetyltransferase